MKIIEFDIPKWIVPKTPYWIEEYNLVLFLSKNSIPKTGYWGPEYYSRFLLFDYNEDTVKQILRDFIVFSEFLYRDILIHCWFRSFPLAKDHLPKYAKEIDDLDEYVKSETVEYYNPAFVHDYEEYPLYEISPKRTRISFKQYFSIYCEHRVEDKTRQLIDFFTANSISLSTLKVVYDNSNMFINNYFILIEALINLEIKNQSGTKICPNCGYKIPAKKKMTDLIKSFLEKQKNLSAEDRKLLNDILLAHYSLRNAFSHSAKYGNALEKFKEAMNKLNQKGLSIQEEVKHADASIMGVNAVDAFLRIKLLRMLEDSIKQVGS